MPDCYRPVGAVLSSAALVAAAALTLAVQARMPEAVAAPTTTTTSTTTTSTTTTSTTTPTTTSTPSSSSASDYPSDEQGYLDSAARCDDSQVLMSFGRTSRALVAICVDSDGGLEYRGVRLSDGTSLTAAAGRSADGSIVATNDGVTYAVSSEMLLVSEGDTVLYRDSWLEFRQPRFSGEPSTTSTSTTATSTAAISTGAPTTTVSTTTVTVTPESSNPDG